VTLTRRPRILVLSMHYEPEPNFITADVARALAEFADVTVITAHPNYPLGRFYPGARYWKPERVRDGAVVIHRLPMFPDHSTSLLKRCISFASFLLPAAVAVPLAVPKPDMVWVYHTPFTTALAALWSKWIAGARLVYTSADLWPESLVATDVASPGPLIAALFRFSRWINARADHIICSTRGILERYREDGVPVDKLTFVPVWTSGIPERLSDEPPQNREKAIVYAGNLGPAQQLETVVRAARIARRDHPDWKFDFYGAGSAETELRDLAATLGVDNVTFHGRVPPDEAFRRTANAFAQVVSLRSSPLFRMTIPSKVPFAMAAGTPIVYALEGEAAKLAAQSGGYPYDAGSPETMVAALERVEALRFEDRMQLRSRMRENYWKSFARESLIAEYRRIIQDQLSRD
jgi:colanic acid biosynthesis glycosyl transferase WcaI